ncbi:MAG TPA: hypothetical protein P5080_00975 [Candidatus Paceibacterota bacterium]|nr:hypothetical protein [Candidatus Pacearchaeota archaeon]HRZ50545.1 hypothetical protein [Candidatus Paceibacterota bacterium]HSA36266.1 hypothetical protein [Candidatus Paceibacterota bacterium]
MTDDAKKDCPLACGYEALRKTKFWWAYKGKDIALTIWLIFAIPLLAVLLWGEKSGWLNVNGWWNAPVIALFIIGIVGAVMDVVITAIVAAEYFKRISKKKNGFMQKLPLDEVIKFTFVAGSPVYAVWFGAARHSGELAKISEDALLVVAIVELFAIAGCIYDANWLFGDYVRHIWANQDKNAIGSVKRSIIRLIGHGYIAAGKCDLVKRSTR